MIYLTNLYDIFVYVWIIILIGFSAQLTNPDGPVCLAANRRCGTAIADLVLPRALKPVFKGPALVHPPAKEGVKGERLLTQTPVCPEAQPPSEPNGSQRGCCSPRNEG